MSIFKKIGKDIFIHYNNIIKNPNIFKKIGTDVFIHSTAIIKHPSLTELKNHIAIGNGVTINTKLNVGNYVHISPYVCCIGSEHSEVNLDDFSFISAGTMIIAGGDDYTGKGLCGPTIPEKYREVEYSSVTFEKFSGCGVNCSIMPNVTMAEGSVLGANSLLTKDTEPWTIYVGSPAKPIKKRNSKIIYDYYKELID